MRIKGIGSKPVLAPSGQGGRRDNIHIFRYPASAGDGMPWTRPLRIGTICRMADIAVSLYPT
jgi:hypothetical protein